MYSLFLDHQRSAATRTTKRKQCDKCYYDLLQMKFVLQLAVATKLRDILHTTPCSSKEIRRICCLFCLFYK